MVRFFNLMTDSTLDVASRQESTAYLLTALLGEKAMEGSELQELLEKRLGVHFTSNLLSFQSERLTTLDRGERKLLRDATRGLGEFLDMNARRFNEEPRIWMPVSYLP